jgi:5-methylcytosine-specific restriction endonuclease McrA
MNTPLERLVWQRADSRCEYCQLPQAFSPLPHAIDHIIARQHDGATVAENLALACFFCNSYKGPNIAGQNPQTGRRVRLFHPRKDRWSRHFAWDGPVLVGRTPMRHSRNQRG